MLKKIKQLIQNASFIKYFKNTSWLLAEKVLRIFEGLFVGVWVARYLGPTQFGLLNYAQSFVLLFAIIAGFGLDGIVVRELVKGESRPNILMGSAFAMKIFGAVLLFPILAITLQFTSNDTYTNVLVFIIASSEIFKSFNVINFFFQSKVQAKYIALANIFSCVLSSVIKILLILFQAPLIVFALIVTFDAIILAAGLIFFYIEAGNKTLLNWRVKWAVAKNLLKDSWPLIFSGLVISFYMKIDQVMIKEMINAEAVGQYAAAVRLSEGWYFIPMIITSSLFPAIINAKKSGEEIYYNRLQKLYDLVVWLAFALALPMTFLSGWLVNLLYGGAYNQAGSVLAIHIWAGVFSFFGTVRSSWILIENLQNIGFYYLFSGLIVNIILNFILIRMIGIQGAAIATLISLFCVTVLFPFFNKKTRISVRMFLKTMGIGR